MRNPEDSVDVLDLLETVDLFGDRWSDIEIAIRNAIAEKPKLIVKIFEGGYLAALVSLIHNADMLGSIGSINPATQGEYVRAACRMHANISEKRTDWSLEPPFGDLQSRTLLLTTELGRAYIEART